jgi:hypothetical protein
MTRIYQLMCSGELGSVELLTGQPGNQNDPEDERRIEVVNAHARYRPPVAGSE